MGTTPLRECKRRNTKEVPCPARSGATPDLTLGATGLAVDATITAPCVDQCGKLNIIEARAKVSQGGGARIGESRKNHFGTVNDTADAVPFPFVREHNSWTAQAGGSRGSNGTRLFRLQLHQNPSYTSHVSSHGRWCDGSTLGSKRSSSSLGASERRAERGA